MAKWQEKAQWVAKQALSQYKGKAMDSSNRKTVTIKAITTKNLQPETFETGDVEKTELEPMTFKEMRFAVLIYLALFVVLLIIISIPVLYILSIFFDVSGWISSLADIIVFIINGLLLLIFRLIFLY